MQTCPFCNFDAGDRPLNAGRCPQCGSVIQWSEEDLAATLQSLPNTNDQSQGTELSQANAQPQDSSLVEPSDNFQTASESQVPSAASDESMADPMTAAEQEPTPASPVPPPTSQSGNNYDHIDDRTDTSTPTPVLLSRLWKDSFAGSGNVRSTLKGQEGEFTVSDTVFSIQARDVRSADDSASESLDYELLDVIGRGGVGVVYSARQASIDRNVALKMLREEYRNREDHRDKFLAEAVLTGELDHPNIVPIYDLGRSHSGELFYSMKNVIGTPWDRAIGSKSLDENLEILLKVADAIAFAHSRGVIHRDLKPENVMLGSYGEVLVMDWGIALPTAEFRKSASILRSQAMGGTPAYMAPEMAKGPIEAIGPASDVYLLGAILFEILTGYPPHFGKNVMDCVTNAAKNEIRETKVTGELMDIALKAMATMPRRRYRQVQDLQAAIRLYQAHSESISLSDNAEQELVEGQQSQDYQKFSRSVFAFQESLALWSENTLAQSGLARAKLAYASTALEKGDYDLGLSLLKPDQPEEQRLIDKLRAAIRERNARQERLRTMRRAAVGLVAFIFVAGFVALAIMWQLYQASEDSKREALAKRAEAVEQRELAEKLKGVAEGERENAVRQQEETEKARHRTELARLQSLADRRRAEESAYLAETGLIGASLAQNNFAIAKSVLQLQAQSNSKSNLRHWEWGRFEYLVQGGQATDKETIVDTHNVIETVETVDCTADMSLLAIGMGDGQCQLWRTKDRRATQWDAGRLVVDLDLDNTGKLLVTCGLDKDRENCVRVWQLSDDKPPVMLKERTLEKQPTSVCFCQAAGSPQIVIGDSKNVARIWSWQTGAADVILLGHNAAINQVRYSPDDRWIGTASADGTVRLFDAKTGKETQRFSGHRGTVWCLAFTPDSRIVASGGEDQRVLLWPVDSSAGPAQQIENARKQVAGQATPPPRFAALQAHTGTVRDVSFNHDGSRLTSAGADNLVCVWKLTDDSAPGRLLQEVQSEGAETPDVSVLKLRGHGGWVHSCAMSSDGHHVLSGADDHSWKVWQVDRYQEQLVLGNGTLAIGDARFTPDGKAIVLAMVDGSIQLWDRVTGKLIDKLAQGHDYLTNRAMFTSDGRRLITAAGDNTLRIWDVARGNQLRVMESSGRNANFQLSPDARWLIATGDEKGVAVWDLAAESAPVRFRAATSSTMKTVSTSDRKIFTEPTCVAISDDGHYFVAGDANGRCEFWDRVTGKRINSIAGHAETVVSVFALPNSAAAESIFMTASADGTVAWWDAVEGKELLGERLPHRAPIHLATLSPDRKYLLTAASLGTGKSRVWLWDVNTRQAVSTYDTAQKSIQDIAFRKVNSLRDIEVIVTTSDLSSSVKELWSWLPTREQFQAIERPEWLSASTWGTVTGTDADHILIYGGRGARLWRWNESRPVMQYRPSSSVTAVALSANGQLLASGNDDGSIVLWDLGKRAPHETFTRVHESRINGLAFSQDGQQLASVGADGLINLRSLITGDNVVRRSSDKTIALNSVAFSPDGSLLAITADDELVRVHDTRTLQQKHKLEGHSGRVICAQFSPDQQWLATGGEDKSIRIWSLTDGSFLTRMMGHSADVTSLDFSGDGLRLLSSSRDTSSKIWDVSRLSQIEQLNEVGDEANGSANMGELLTLEQHTSDVIFSQFSPDGSEILSAGEEGLAIIWPACKVPIALRLSKPSVDYVVGSGRLALDHRAIISQTDMLDVRSATLRVRLLPEDPNAAATELPADFTDAITLDTTDGVFQQHDESIVVQATQQQVAAWKSADEQIEMQFSPTITHQLAQQLIRHLRYEAYSKKMDQAAKHTRTYQFELLNAAQQSGNAASEELIVNLIDPKNNETKSDRAIADKRTSTMRSSNKSAALNHVQAVGH